MQSLEYLRDIVRGLDDNRVLAPEKWLNRELLPAQRRLVALKNKYRLFAGGVGSGKSYLGSLLALSHMKPGCDGLVVCPVYRMMSAVAQSLMLEHLNVNDCSYSFKKSEEILDYNGSRVFFRSAERPELLRGLSVGWAWIDEGALVSEALWKVVLGRLRQGTPKAWITTTPAGFNWVYDYFVGQEDPDYGFVQAGTEENTFLPAEYVTSLKRNYSGSYHDQELLGAFTSPSGLVYPEFRRDVHVVDPFPIPESWEKVAAIDHGFVHPFATLWCAFDEDRRMYCYREYKRAETLLKDHAEAIRAGGEVAYYLSDHDAQDRQELAQLGILTYAADKAVLPGIQSVKRRLEVQGDGKPRLFVFRNCAQLIREFSTYSWHQSNSLISDTEKVVKIGDDLLDCCRYISFHVDRRGKALASCDLLAALHLN